MRMRKRSPYPLLLGQPSPSIAKIKRMTRSGLALQAERLATEAARVEAKLVRLKAHKPSPQERIALLDQQLKRLSVLEQAAREQLAAHPV